MANWLPFDPTIYAPMVQNIQNERGTILNPPPNNWSDANRGLIRQSLHLENNLEDMKIVDIIIAISATKYGETAGMTTAELVNRGWLVFHQQGLERISHLEQEIIAIRGDIAALIDTLNAKLNAIMAHLGIPPGAVPQGAAQQ